MIRVESMYISPVKSLGLATVEHAYLDKSGIAGDRSFFIIDAQGVLFTQREYGPLVRVRTAFEAESGRLDLSFPDGSTVAGIPEPGDSVEASFFGRTVVGLLLNGEWSEALDQHRNVALSALFLEFLLEHAFDGLDLPLGVL